MSIQLQNGKKYITTGGWVVEIASIYQYGRNFFFATQKTSPGKTRGADVVSYTQSNYIYWAKKQGWQYEGNNVEQPVDIVKDLKIVSEYPYPLELPEGYKWAGGFPKLADVTDKGYYLTTTGKVFNANEEKVRFFTVDDVPHIGVRRIALEPIAEPQAQYYLTDTVAYNGSRSFYIYKDGQWFFKDRSGEGKSLALEDEIRSYIRQGKYKSITKEEFDKLINTPSKDTASPYPKYYIYVDQPKNWGVVRYDEKRCHHFQIRENENNISGGPFTWFHDDILERGKWIEVTKGEMVSRFDKDPLSEVEEKVAASPPKAPDDFDIRWPVLVPSVPIKKEEEMNQSKFVSVITTGGSAVAKAANYLYVEPAKIIGGYVKRSIRYIVFTGTIAGIIYGANNPDALKKRLASVLPKITIEAPSVLK